MSLYPAGSLPFGMEVKWLNPGHDFSRDLPAAATAMFYAAAADVFATKKL